MMKTNSIFFIALITSLLASSCIDIKELDRPFPRVKTLEVKNVSSTGAILCAEAYETSGHVILDHGYLYEQNNLPTPILPDTIALGAFTGDGEFSHNLALSIEPQKVYMVRSFLRTSEHFVLGNAVFFNSNGPCNPE